MSSTRCEHLFFPPNYISVPYCLLLAEKRLAVVEVGHPWKDVTVHRKLPPLKYYYDFEMSKCIVKIMMCIYGMYETFIIKTCQIDDKIFFTITKILFS